MLGCTNKDPHCDEGIIFVETMLYDCAIDSRREAIYSPYLVDNVKVVDTDGIHGRGLMYWLLEATSSLIVFKLENKGWETLAVGKR